MSNFKTLKVKFVPNKKTPRWRDRWGADKKGDWKPNEVNKIPAGVARHMVHAYGCFELVDEEDKMQRPDEVKTPKKKTTKKSAKKKSKKKR